MTTGTDHTAWRFEHAVETDVDRDALWRTWVDVTSWSGWNAGAGAPRG